MDECPVCGASGSEPCVRWVGRYPMAYATPMSQVHYEREDM